MTFYTADLFLGSREAAQKRHFRDADHMNNRIVENWNSLVTQDDRAYILGGVGDFDFLTSLNGDKVVLMTEREDGFYRKYILSVTTDESDPFNQEMFQTYAQNAFNARAMFQRSIRHRDALGNTVQLTTGARDPELFSVAGMGEDYHRCFSGGVNASIFANGMFPLSEYDVSEMAKRDARKRARRAQREG